MGKVSDDFRKIVLQDSQISEAIDMWGCGNERALSIGSVVFGRSMHTQVLSAFQVGPQRGTRGEDRPPATAGVGQHNEVSIHVIFVPVVGNELERTSGGIRFIDANEFFKDRTRLRTSKHGVIPLENIHLEMMTRISHRGRIDNPLIFVSPRPGSRSSQFCKVMSESFDV